MPSVLHVITGLGRGGAETMLVQLAKALHAKGWPQHVVSLTGRGAHGDTLESAGIPVTALGITSRLTAPAGQLRLVRLVQRLRPDVLQGWMYHGNLAAAIAHRLCSHTAERRLIWNLRASNMDAERYSQIIRWNTRLSHWPDMVIANSKAGMEFHLGEGFQPRSTAIIPNGVDTQRFRPDRNARKAVRETLGIPADALIAVKVARVDPMKDHAVFLEAMKCLPDMHGLLVGKGTKSLSLPANVQALGLRSDVPTVCAAADIVVSSSAFGEGFPNALAEGMSAGLIPVATNVGDAQTIIGDTGSIVPTGDPRALAKAIAAQAVLPRQERRRAGGRARKRIETHFTLQKAVDAFATVYDGEVRNNEAALGQERERVAVQDGN